MNGWRAAGAVSGITLASRLLGMVRDALMMAVLGAGWASGTFLLVWMLPNLLRRLFGEGALTASFVPVYTRVLGQEGPAGARSLLARVSGVVLAVLLALVLLVAAASLVVPASALPMDSAEGEAELFLVLCRALFPYALPVCLVALYAGALNCHRVFALPAAAPVVLNVFWIGGLLFALQAGIESDADIAGLLAMCLLGAGAVQLVMVALPLARRGVLAPPRLGLPPPGDPARQVFAAMVPTVLGMSLVQISALVDQGIAYFLVSPGANNYVHLANRLLLFPHALTALALAVVAFPGFAELGSRDDVAGLREAVDRASASTLLLTIPAAVGMAMIAPDLVEVLFQHGRFESADADQTSKTTIFLVLGLPLLGVAQLHARAFYALGRPGVPARLAGWLVLVNLVLGLLFVLGFGWGTPGLAAATTLSGLGNAFALRRALRAGVDSPSPLRGVWLRCGIATLAMALVVYFVRPEAAGAGLVEKALLRLLLPVGAGIATYAAIHWLRARILSEPLLPYSSRTNSR